MLALDPFAVLSVFVFATVCPFIVPDALHRGDDKGLSTPDIITSLIQGFDSSKHRVTSEFMLEDETYNLSFGFIDNKLLIYDLIPPTSVATGFCFLLSSSGHEKADVLTLNLSDHCHEEVLQNHGSQFVLR